MNEEKIKIIKELLAKLITEVENLIKSEVSAGNIKSEDELYFRWKLNDFNYDDHGVTSSGATSEYVIKKSWIREVSKISEPIKNGQLYKDVLEKLIAEFSQNKSVERDVNLFLNKIISEQLALGNAQKIDGNSLIERFADDLLQRPVKCGAEIELQGIIMKPREIEPSYGFMIRQPIKEDLEKEVPFYSPIRSYYDPLSYPSSIASVEFSGRRAQDIQTKIALMIVILKLFRVSSIKYLSYKMYSDSITDIAARGGVFLGSQEQVLETDIIKRDDESKLKIFWGAIEKLLPLSLYNFGEKELTPVCLAYDRYNDALMHNGLLERRIASVVMGLEALLLGETQELKYRLGLRTARVVSFLDDNPQKVKQIVKDAYDIRSKFAHGSRLSYKDIKSLKLKYGDIKNLFLTVIDYLRQLIVVMILIQKSKEEFIDLVDDSLIEREKETLLNNLLSQSRQILS
jgi:hypothetical protein